MIVKHAQEEPSGPDDAASARDEGERFGAAPDIFGVILVAFVAWLILTQTG
ncbi:MAG: hypothetical protein H6891_04685 [Brucellaceae bacterium]|nr:hypothetical protein [Brucellaceae bacterium]